MEQVDPFAYPSHSQKPHCSVHDKTANKAATTMLLLLQLTIINTICSVADTANRGHDVINI